jgi:hypothetical protein
MPQNEVLSITESLRALLCENLDALLGRPSGHKGPVACFEQLRLWLEALPLASGEFSLAVNRLANARQYLESGEYGAARFELRLLRRSLEVID